MYCTLKGRLLHCKRRPFIMRCIPVCYTGGLFSRYAYGLERAAVVSEHDVELARLEYLTALGVVVREVFLGDVEGHFLGLACLEHDAPEAFKLLDGACYRGNGVVHVELHHLAGVLRACVGHGDCCLEAAARTCNRRLAVAEGGVTEAVTEGIERVVDHVEPVGCVLAELLCALGYGTAGVQVVVVHGQLAGSARESHGKASARGYVAEDHVADGVGSLAASEPYVEYCVDVVLLPCEYCGTA